MDLLHSRHLSIRSVPFANSARDVARVLEVIAGHDERDSTSAKVPVPDYLSAMDRNVNGLKLGLPKEYFNDALNPEIRPCLSAVLPN